MSLTVWSSQGMGNTVIVGQCENRYTLLLYQYDDLGCNLDWSYDIFSNDHSWCMENVLFQVSEFSFVKEHTNAKRWHTIRN